MNTFLPEVPKAPPILLVYPSVHQRLSGGETNEKGIGLLMKTCYELAQHRPLDPADRRDGYHFSKAEGFLFVVWSHEENEPDIFIMGFFAHRTGKV